MGLISWLPFPVIFRIYGEKHNVVLEWQGKSFANLSYKCLLTTFYLTKTWLQLCWYRYKMQSRILKECMYVIARREEMFLINLSNWERYRIFLRTPTVILLKKTVKKLCWQFEGWWSRLCSLHMAFLAGLSEANKCWGTKCKVLNLTSIAYFWCCSVLRKQ